VHLRAVGCVRVRLRLRLRLRVGVTFECTSVQLDACHPKDAIAMPRSTSAKLSRVSVRVRVGLGAWAWAGVGVWGLA
jgi:hypothetical protein